MSEALHDIKSRADIEHLVNEFYAKVKADQLLAPVFANVNWPHHLPIMYNFWSSVLLGDLSYSGNPLAKHMALDINKDHFSKWLELFTATVDENFLGFNATEAKSRALTIANLFQYKMGLDL